MPEQFVLSSQRISGGKLWELRRIYTYLPNCKKYDMRTEDTVIVSMRDVCARLPIVWSRPMSKDEANAAAQIFKAIGYFDVFDVQTA